MSRICGIANYAEGGRTDQQESESLVATLRHGSSYYATTYVSTGGAARLSQITFPGSENFGSSYIDDDLLCVVSGYVTNISGLGGHLAGTTGRRNERITPARVVAALVRERNFAAFESFNGLWAFAAWDRRYRRLYLGADRYGIRPLYYRHQDDQVIFGSEIKAISHTAVDLSVDRTAIEDLLVLGMITDNRTLYEQVHRVPAATILQFDTQGTLEYRYWWFDRLQVDPSLTLPDFMEENIRLFDKSMARLVPLAPHAAGMLSSGFDSRRILLELRKYASPPTFTSSVQMGGQNFETDTLIARALCAELDLPNISVDLYDPVSEPELSRVAATLLDSETNQHRWILPLLHRLPVGSGVNFDGLGGDILLFGKQVVLDDDRKALDQGKLPRSIEVELGPAISAYLRRPPDVRPLTERIREQLELIPPSPYQVSHWFVGEWTRRRTSLFGQGLVSLKMESVYPFMDNDYVDLCYKLAPEYKVNRDLQGEILRYQYPEIMSRIPSSHYPAIGTSPDDHCRPYVRPIPSDYAPQRKYHSSLATARAVIGAPALLAQLSPACLAVALGVHLLGPVVSATSGLFAGSWRVRALFPLLHVYESLNDRRRQETDLAAARQFVFGENE